MAKISETELQRRLKYLERNSGSAEEHNYVSNEDPQAGNYSEGDTHYNAATNNLWLFKNGSWVLDSTILHIRYATDVTVNPPTAQTHIVGFSEDPLSSDGSLKNWRGLWWGNLTASTNSLAYEWYDINTNPPELERYYTENVGLRSSVGTPDNPGVGITWTLGGPTPNTLWLADRFTIDGQKGLWEVYPVQATNSGLPFIRYEKTGFNQPTLGDSVWIDDVVLAATSFTGKTFSNQKELGYGTVVTIVYDDGTLAGKYIRSNGIDTWVAPASLIEGDLVVDGTIAGDKIQANTIEALNMAANSIDATKLVVSGANAIGASTIGADIYGSAASAEIAANTYSDGLRSALISNEIATAQATADGKIESYFQTTQPTTGISIGDLWFDTDDGNKPHRYNGSSWVDVQDAGLRALANDAQATADGKIESYFQTSAPTTNITVGDLWFDTDDGNKPYRYNGTSWVAIQDEGIKTLANDAQATADGKITTYYNTTAPTVSLSVGDLWVDTDDSNRMYRYNGSSWVDIQDAGLASLANNAQATADGKITTYYNNSQPTGSIALGDLWIDTDDSNRMYRYSGSSWVDVQDTTVADNIYTTNTTTIEGGNITTGTITSDSIQAGAVTANKITLTENVQLTGDSSGIIFDKTSLTDGTHGAFYGRSISSNGTAVAGFSISSATSSVLMDSSGTFRMIGVDIFTGAPGAVTEYTTVGTHYYNVGVATDALDIDIVAGGGSGSSNAAGDRPSSYKVNGNAGSPSSVSFYSGANGTGTLLGSYTTTGGAGAVYSVRSNVITAVGAAGEASSKASGGLGGTATSPSVTPAAGIGAGGGSPGARGYNGSPDAATLNGGGAGSTRNLTSVPSGTLSVKVVVGAGGAKATVPSAASDLGIVTGAAGGTGYVSISNPAGGGNLVDFNDIWSLPDQSSLTTSTMTGNTNGGYASLNLGSGGAGWYYFQDFSTGCLLQYAKGWHNDSSNSDGIINNAWADTAGIFYCSSTPRLYSLKWGNNNNIYTGGTIKWVKIK